MNERKLWPLGAGTFLTFEKESFFIVFVPRKENVHDVTNDCRHRLFLSLRGDEEGTKTTTDLWHLLFTHTHGIRYRSPLSCHKRKVGIVITLFLAN